MRALSPDECVSWCASRGYSAVHLAGYRVPTAAEPEGLHIVSFCPPSDSGQRVSFARHLFALLDPAPEYLVWLGEWGVWPSNQHLPLVMRLREALGERRPLIEAPGHAIPHAELEDGLSLFLAAFLFVWDCHVFSSSGHEAFSVSHDERGWFASRSELKAARARAQFEQQSAGSA